MDLHPTPFPGKSRASNLKTNKKSVSENEKEAPVPMQKRVFGTSRSTNVLPVKITTEKPIKKPNNGVSRQGLRDTAKPRVIKRQPVGHKLVETEKRTNGVVSSPEGKANLAENEELSNRVVSSPAIKVNLGDTKESNEGVVSSPRNKAKLAEAEDSTDGVVSSPAIKVNLGDTKESIDGVVSSPTNKAKLAEAEDSTDGVVSSPAIKVNLGDTKESIDGVVSSPRNKAKLAEAEDSTDGVVSSPAIKVNLGDTKESTDGVVSSPRNKAKLAEVKDSIDGVVSSPAIKVNLGDTKESIDGVLASSAVKDESVELKEVKNEITSSPAVKPVEKKISGQSKTKLKKNVCFQEPVMAEKAGQEEMRTPVSSSSLIRPKRLSGTPYLSAEKCSKCRQHGLESSSYWITQIRLAESSEKHVVSVAFFRLALQCNAEPVRTLRIELRRYLAKYGSLSKEMEWKNISCSYGLLKGESSTSRLSSALEKAAQTSETRATDDLGEEQKNVKDSHCIKEIADEDGNFCTETSEENKSP